MHSFKSNFRFLFLFLLLMPCTASAETLWFPHVSCVGDWKTEIAILNPDASQELNGVLKSFCDDGTETLQQKTISLAPHARQQIVVANEMANASHIGYMALEISSGTAVGYTKFYQDGIYRVAVPAVTRINTDTILVPHIASNSYWWTGISLVNTTSEVKNLSFEFNNGMSRTETLAAHEHKAFTIKSMFGGVTPEDVVSAVIRNADGVIGLELFGSNLTTGKKMLSGILLKDQVALKLYYPHIASNNDWWTGIVAYNSSSDDSVLTITPYTMDGTALASQTITLPGWEKYIGTAAGLSFPKGTEWFEISASSPVCGFELFGTTNGKNLAGYSGVNISAKSGVFAKREMVSDGWTDIAFVNVKDTVATVTLMAYGDDGVLVASKTITLNPHQKKVEPAEALFAADINAATNINYSSDQEIVGFQLNGSNDGMLLDGLPAMAPDTIVSFPDPNLEAAIRRNIGKPTGNILSSDLGFLFYLSANSNAIQNLTGLEYCKNMTELFLGGNQLSDISPLAGLPQLKGLDISDNQLSDISPLAGLTELKGLNLSNNQLSDISLLAGLTQLTNLHLGGNQLSDISPLAGLTQLKRLHLNENQISDVFPLTRLPQLRGLYLNNNQLSDISSLTGLTQLTWLDLGDNQLSDISPLAGLTQLAGLDLYGNQLSDISPLAGLPQLRWLDLYGNQLSDISPLVGLIQLTRLNLDNNQLSDISSLAGLPQLRGLYLNNNQLSDISSLAGLPQLRGLYLNNNQLSDISSLTGLPQLRVLYLSNNQVSDISPLMGLSELKTLKILNNPLSGASCSVHVPQLESQGVKVSHSCQ